MSTNIIRRPLWLLVWVIAGLTAALLTGGVLYAESQTSLVNGDFETGDLSGWTVFTTGNGTVGGPAYPKVVPFDTDNDGTASNSAQFLVGQVIFDPDEPEGGGIYQVVSLAAGERYP